MWSFLKGREEEEEDETQSGITVVLEEERVVES